MKNLRLTVFALLLAGAANAQFFQRVYGAANTREVLESGTNYDAGISISQKGFVMAGYTPTGTTVASNSVMLTRTSLAGLPVFNNRITLNAQLGPQVNAKAKKVITLANGQIAVFGDFNNGAIPTSISNQFFLMVTDPLGNPLFVRSYSVGTGPVQVEATSVTQSQTNQANLYVCGYAIDGNGSKDPVVMSVQAASGVLNWGYTYYDSSSNAYEWTVEDLVESPYPNPNTAQTDLALVGRYVLNPGDAGQGAFSTVDAATGAITSYIYQFGDQYYDAGFNAIAVATNPYGGSAGFVIAGFTNSSVISPFAPPYNTWALKIDPQANVQFSSILKYANYYQNSYGNDIIERVNTFGDYEYYVGGYVDQGYFGNEDEVVYKLTYYGQPIANGSEFTYGGPGDERVLDLAYYNFGVPTAAVGLSMFNTTSGSFSALGNGDFYHVRSYFNGVTACNFILDNPIFDYGPKLLNIVKQELTSGIRSRSLFWQLSSMQDALVCTAPSVPGGANTRLGSNGIDLAESNGNTVFPNPLSLDHPQLTISFDAAGSGEDVEIEVMNALGQLCLQTKQTLAEGETQLQLDMSAGTQLSAGVYIVVVHRGDEVITHKVSVQ